MTQQSRKKGGKINKHTHTQRRGGGREEESEKL